MTARITDTDRKFAKNCLHCPICRRARKNQHGMLYWFVKKVESSICPQCRAYEKVYRRKAHEPLAPDVQD